MSNKTRGTHFKRLLLSFLVLYTAYSLIPTAVYAIGKMGNSDAIYFATAIPEEEAAQ